MNDSTQQPDSEETVTNSDKSFTCEILLPFSREQEFSSTELSLAPGDFVILESRYGVDIGQVVGVDRLSKKSIKNLVPIYRKANAFDMEKYTTNQQREEEALKLCKQGISTHKLDMKLVAAHYLPEEPKVIFLFTAESRIDFRELVKDLVAQLHSRVELRQIGVRDETRVLGGLAVCGRDYCCHSITDKLGPVSIKMAKDQNISLNAAKISGSCGRLLCCLAYEHDYYVECRKKLPSEGSRITMNGEVWKVVDVNVGSKKVGVRADDGRFISAPSCGFSRDGSGKWTLNPDSPACHCNGE